MNAEAPQTGPAAGAVDEGGRGLPLMQYWFVVVRRRWMILLADRGLAIGVEDMLNH